METVTTAMRKLRARLDESIGDEQMSIGDERMSIVDTGDEYDSIATCTSDLLFLRITPSCLPIIQQQPYIAILEVAWWKSAASFRCSSTVYDD
jgi:hypothetical protein